MSKAADIEAAKALLALAEAEAEAAPAPTPAPVVEEPVDEAWLDASTRFDPSKPYGRVWDGSGVSKARYQQNGLFFDHAGELVKE